MALFGFGRERKTAGASELVLAYLEDAQRVRSPLVVLDARKVDLAATLQGIDEAAGSLTLSLGTPLRADPGSRLELILYHEGMRIGGTTRLLELRSGQAVLELPDTLELRERRALPRARMNPKEGANLTGLTSLFEGVGINGLLENLSEGGCRVRVEKAMNIKDERRLPLGSALVPVGHPFMLLKLNKVPRCPAVLETAGRVVYVDDRSGLCLGIAFEKLRSDAASAIRTLVSSRLGSTPTVLPPKARRKSVTEDVETERPPRDMREEPPSLQRVAKAEDETNVPREPKPASPSVQPPVEATSTPNPPAPRNSALLRLKKRERSLVVLGQGSGVEALKAYLLESEGYGQVHGTSDWAETIARLQAAPVDLLFVDLDRPILEAMEMLAKLRESGLGLPPVVLAADEVSRGLVVAATRVGVSQLLVRPYSLDETLGRMLESLLGLNGLSGSA